VTRRNRVWSIAALSVAALAAAPLLSACGAGQIANTAEMVSAVPGANASTEIKTGNSAVDGELAVRNVSVEYLDTNGYPAGGTAPLAVYIVNDTPAPVTLVGATATYTIPGDDTASGRATVVLTGGPVASPTAVPAPPTTAPARPSGSGSASASVTPAPVVTTPPPAPAAGTETFQVTVPQAPSPLTQLTQANGTYLQLDKLSKPLTAGAVVHIIFTFKLANGTTWQLGDDPAQPVDAPFGPPLTPPARSPISLSPAGE